METGLDMGRYGLRLVLLVCVVLALGASPIGASAVDRKAPKGCLKALNEAEAVVAISAEVSGAVADFFFAQQSAAEEGSVTGDVVTFLEALTAATQDLTARTQDATEAIQPRIAAYNLAAAKCRRGR